MTLSGEVEAEEERSGSGVAAAAAAAAAAADDDDDDVVAVADDDDDDEELDDASSRSRGASLEPKCLVSRQSLQSPRLFFSTYTEKRSVRPARTESEARERFDVTAVAVAVAALAAVDANDIITSPFKRSRARAPRRPGARRR